MKKTNISFLRGLTGQLLAITVLPLTLLLLVIAFGSVSLHQQDMRTLVGERDERAVQSAAAALTSELHHRAAGITNLVALAKLSGDTSSIPVTADLTSDFDGGFAYLDMDKQVVASDPSSSLWNWVAQNNISLASSSNAEPVFSTPFLDPKSKKILVIISQVVPSRGIIVAGAFSPDSLARETLFAAYPHNMHVTIFLLDPARQILFASGPLAAESIAPDHPGVPEALRGESGAQYVQMAHAEHVVAYSSVTSTGWALITQEDWEMVSSPSLKFTQLAPLVIVPVFILALIALWFVVTRIVQPLQKLETKAAALAWGDFETIKESVGGISEVQHLQSELAEMSRKVKSSQNGLHNYIGAITSAQEEERLRLARELHDETIQSVIALKQRIQLTEKSVKDHNGKKSLQELENLAEQTIENLRLIIRGLRPIYLEDLGLVTALEMLARETKTIQVDFSRTGNEQRLKPDVELALYRIAQEALSNVSRHAKASRAAININFSNHEVKLEVSDDGVGFTAPASPTDFAPSGHFGLLGIKERCELIRAKFEVKSKTGDGTQVTVRLLVI